MPKFVCKVIEKTMKEVEVDASTQDEAAKLAEMRVDAGHVLVSDVECVEVHDLG
ncbi:MAG TPA: hypothetical protein VKT27_02815 [Candidatus Binataceae bacterium]|nr:hypothetical protein [Candidatus Binataceae bacterium]